MRNSWYSVLDTIKLVDLVKVGVIYSCVQGTSTLSPLCEGERRREKRDNPSFAITPSELGALQQMAPERENVTQRVTRPVHGCFPLSFTAMSSLNKLAIRGIRSFDDKQVSVIEFFSPVTVIVGHNGSGKTTIIECLKYATTGDQPPNTRGGAFVHDPKMANEKEVKAQVKLRFHAANGQRMLVVRNLSVTAKKTGLTMKTLESILGLADSNADKGGKAGALGLAEYPVDQIMFREG